MKEGNEQDEEDDQDKPIARDSDMKEGNEQDEEDDQDNSIARQPELPTNMKKRHIPSKFSLPLTYLT